MSNDEILRIFNSFKSKKEFLDMLKIPYQHRNAILVDNDILEILNCIGVYTRNDISALAFRNRYRLRLEEEYNKNPNKCIICGNNVPYKRINTKTCSSKCCHIKANKERGKHSEETKRKISDGVNKTLLSKKCNNDNYKLISECISLGILENYNNVNYTDRYINISHCKEHICPICGKIYHTYLANNGDLTDYSACSNECLKLKMKNIVSNKIQERIKNGTHIGWQSRNIISYPEKFFINVLTNNNIKFEHNFYIKKYHYFLDFFITKNGKLIDLEIDGSQHKDPIRLEHDIIRDKNLKNENYLVYRIEWNSINNSKGKELMKNKIEKFIKFYNDL